MTLAQILRDFLPTVYQKYGPLNARQYGYKAEVAFGITKKQFDYVDAILVELREKKVLPWTAVLDSEREFRPWMVEDSEDPNKHVKDAANYFKKLPERFDLPRWQHQPIVPVIFSEKAGMIQYFEMVAMDRAVTIYAQRGQVGKSHLHEEVLPWMLRLAGEGRKVKILYLGDCDDEGYQIPLTLISTITRWVGEMSKELGLGGGGTFDMDQHDLWPRGEHKRIAEGSSLIFRRVALSPEQIEEWKLSKMEIKKGVTTKSTIAKKFVNFKAELEAIDPDMLRKLIVKAIDEDWNERAENRRLAKVKQMRKPITEKIGELTEGWNL